MARSARLWVVAVWAAAQWAGLLDEAHPRCVLPADHRSYNGWPASLLLAALFAFTFLVKFKLYPEEVRSINLDTDWFYRRFGDGLFRWTGAMSGRLSAAISNRIGRGGKVIADKLFNLFSPAGALSRDVPSGIMAIWTSVLLGLVMVIAYVAG